MIRSEDDHRVRESATGFEGLPHPPQVVIDLPDQSLIGWPHRLPDFVAHEVRALFLLAVRGEHRMRLSELAPIPLDRQAVLERVTCVVR